MAPTVPGRPARRQGSAGRGAFGAGIGQDAQCAVAALAAVVRRRSLVDWCPRGYTRSGSPRARSPVVRRPRARPARRAGGPPRVAVRKPSARRGPPGQRRGRRRARRRRMHSRAGSGQGHDVPGNWRARPVRPQRPRRPRAPRPRAPAAETPRYPRRRPAVRALRRRACALRPPYAQGVSRPRTPAARAEPAAVAPAQGGTTAP